MLILLVVEFMVMFQSPSVDNPVLPVNGLSAGRTGDNVPPVGFPFGLRHDDGATQGPRGNI